MALFSCLTSNKDATVDSYGFFHCLRFRRSVMTVKVLTVRCLGEP